MSDYHHYTCWVNGDRESAGYVEAEGPDQAAIIFGADALQKARGEEDEIVICVRHDEVVRWTKWLVKSYTDWSAMEVD